MIDKNKIVQWVEEHLNETDKFLVETKVTPQNKISIFIDADSGVTVEDCITLSRFIESHLDRDKEDFELNVSSAGLDQPLKLPRQYQKNIGRQVTIVTKTGEKYTGKLTAFAGDLATIELAASKKKKQKNNIEEELIKNIPIQEIKETKIIITL